MKASAVAVDASSTMHFVVRSFSNLHAHDNFGGRGKTFLELTHESVTNWQERDNNLIVEDCIIVCKEIRKHVGVWGERDRNENEQS